MPSLFRFLTVVAIIVGVVYGAMLRAGEFRQPEAPGNDRHHPCG